LTNSISQSTGEMIRIKRSETRWQLINSTSVYQMELGTGCDESLEGWSRVLLSGIVQNDLSSNRGGDREESGIYINYQIVPKSDS